jgi:ornithine cyclodeaminase
MESTRRSPDDGECDILAVGASEVLATLAGKELAIIDIIKQAYELHRANLSSLPHSTFLNFPRSPLNRIIALPAYLDSPINTAGVKWIASFPANLEQGLDRASAMLILNSTDTGRPKAIMEGSIISTKRTAASAALAASVLVDGAVSVTGLIGCGKINLEVARFLLALNPEIKTFLIHDKHYERASKFQVQCDSEFPSIQTEIVSGIDDVLNQAPLVSFGTTAVAPHVADLECCLPGTVILHISLRDLAPEVILASDNIVDDVDHVCRARTSIHLAEQMVNHRAFIRCTLGDILQGSAPPREDKTRPAIFSPFGLGILDIALGEYVFQRAASQGGGKLLESFLPESWKRDFGDLAPDLPRLAIIGKSS